MKNKKGFTLAELIGVITLLGIIALITVPMVNKYIDSSRTKAYNAEIQTLESAAKNWYVKNSLSVTFDENGYYALNIEILKKSEFLEDKDIINPQNQEENITGCIMIKNENDKYSYEYNKDCLSQD